MHDFLSRFFDLSKFPTITNTTIEQLASAGGFYVGVYAFVMTSFGVFVAIIGLIFTAYHNSMMKKVEIRQKEFENALNLLKIVGSNDSAFLKLGALVALEDFPQYYNVFLICIRFTSKMQK